MAALTANTTEISIGGTDIENLLSVSSPSISTTMIDTTDLSSTARTFVSGMVDGGDCSFELAYDPSLDKHEALEADLGTLVAVVITWSDDTTCTFVGILTNLSPAANLDDKLTCSATVKVSGAVSF